jgi:hypothetical protein
VIPASLFRIDQVHRLLAHGLREADLFDGIKADFAQPVKFGSAVWEDAPID